MPPPFGAGAFNRERNMGEIWVVEHDWFGVFGFYERSDAIKTVAETARMSVDEVERKLKEGVDEVEFYGADGLRDTFSVKSIYMSKYPIVMGEAK
jgi:hypothetical protein